MHNDQHCARPFINSHCHTITIQCVKQEKITSPAQTTAFPAEAALQHWKCCTTSPQVNLDHACHVPTSACSASQLLLIGWSPCSRDTTCHSCFKPIQTRSTIPQTCFPCCSPTAPAATADCRRCRPPTVAATVSAAATLSQLQQGRA